MPRVIGSREQARHPWGWGLIGACVCEAMLGCCQRPLTPVLSKAGEKRQWQNNLRNLTAIHQLGKENKLS